MKYTVLILATVCAFGFGSWMCTGCKTAKVSSSDTSTTLSVTKKDSANKVVVSSVHSDVSNTSIHTEKDSLATLPGSEVDWLFNLADLQPAIDMNGDTVGREYQKDSGTVHGKVGVDKKGKIHVECKEDSFRYVCLRLIKDSIATHEFVDSSMSAVTDQWHSEIKDSSSVASTVVTVDEKKHGGFVQFFINLWHTVRNVFSWFGLICALVIIILIIKKIL